MNVNIVALQKELNSLKKRRYAHRKAMKEISTYEFLGHESKRPDLAEQIAKIRANEKQINFAFTIRITRLRQRLDNLLLKCIAFPDEPHDIPYTNVHPPVVNLANGRLDLLD